MIVVRELFENTVDSNDNDDVATWSGVCLLGQGLLCCF